VTGTLDGSHDAHNRCVIDVEAPGYVSSQAFTTDVPPPVNLTNLMGSV
jgi:hypothetical protein